MEFQTGPVPVSEEYRKHIAQHISISNVAFSGLFQEDGTFAVTERGKMPPLFGFKEGDCMWALNLLKFPYAKYGVWTRSDGFLVVYPERMTRHRGDAIKPIHTMDPGNVRFVDEVWSSMFRIDESGWVFDERAALDQKRKYREEGSDLSREQLKEIVANAEAGRKPPFFDDYQYIKVEPESVGKFVHVIRFLYVNDFVIVDPESRRLVGKYTQDLLSQKRWEPK